MSLESQAKEAITIVNANAVSRKTGPMPHKAEFLLILLWGMCNGWGDTSIACRARVTEGRCTTTGTG